MFKLAGALLLLPLALVFWASVVNMFLAIFFYFSEIVSDKLLMLIIVLVYVIYLSRNEK